MKRISLLEDWKLIEMPLNSDIEAYGSVIEKVNLGMDVGSLPCDVHTVLKEHGKINDPLVGNGSFECSWVEDRSWWFLKRFTLNESDLSPYGIELFIEMLDIHADIFLNGNYVGHHASAMYPFNQNVASWLKAGDNVLVIRLTTGLERVNDTDIAEVRDFVACEYRRRREGRGDDRRTMLRKPQYVFGWDQSPRVATCAIAGDVRLQILDEAAVRNIRFETIELVDGKARLLVEAEIESRALTTAREFKADMVVEFGGETVYRAEKQYLSQCGTNYIDFSFTMDEPELWWPNGYGKQNLYKVKVKVTDSKGGSHEETIETGIRTVKLDTSAINEKERQYTFVVNGKPIYCRGMDFIMTNHLYAEVTDEQQERLIKAAKDANFCTLRFWDGNIYQTDGVYRLCDKYGLMVIQNFCFACGAYPDHIESFCDEVEKEAEYQIKRLRNHPCLSMFYGNGENSSILMNYLGMNFFEKYDYAKYPGGTYLYNTLLPRIHRANTVSVGYQCTTPFGGFDSPECEERGDRHYYPFLNLNPDNQEYRISKESIDPLKCKFITEGGIMGPPSAKALAAYCGGVEHTSYDDPIFLHHRNTFERDAVRDAVYKHYTGKRELTLEEYCLYGGLFQGTLLGYEADHIRVQPHCSGSVLWCMNDGFGEVGFSIMDHFGNPKPAYYFLKRAYAPIRMVLKRTGDGCIGLYIANSTPRPYESFISYGYTSFDGDLMRVSYTHVKLEAFAPATLVLEFEDKGMDTSNGVIFASAVGLDSVTLYDREFRQLNLPKQPELTVEDVVFENGELSFTVETDMFAHGVHFGFDESVILSDCYFNLLPGESKRVTAKGNVTPDDIKPRCVFLKK